MGYTLAYSLALLGLCALSYADLDKSVCVPGQISGSSSPKPFPKVPDVFASHISMYVVGNKTTREMYELFDAPNNRALIRETEATGPFRNISLTGTEIYNFYSNQIVELIGLPDQSYICAATQLDGKGSDTFIFGESASSAKGFSAKTAFRVSDAFPPVYQGQKTLDNGVVTDWWKDCIYISGLDATVTAEWYFTADGQWTSSLGVQVPVMLKVNGKANLGGARGRTVANVYTFSGFQDFLTDHQQEYFEIPSGTVCPYLASFKAGASDKDAHTMPAIAKDGTFRFSAELIQVVDDETRLVNNIREIYDNKLKMSRYDFNAAGFVDAFNNPLADRPFSEIHDFNTGLVYVVDREKRNCSIAPLAESKHFDVATTTNNHVRMKSVAEFFGLGDNKGSSMNWTYTGQRKIRDIMADVYIAERLGYPEGAKPDAKSVWEIAFMSTGSVNVGERTANFEFQEPMRLYLNDQTNSRVNIYNIYDFDESEPDLYLYDVASCYSDDQKTKVSFKLPATKLDVIENNRKQFYYWIMLSIAGELAVTPNRIHGIRFERTEDKENIEVSFTILDPPTIIGSTRDDAPKDYMISTQDAITLLKTAIDNGEFVIEGGDLDSGNMVQLTAIKGSLNQKSYVTETITQVKLDQGAAAGIGIAFIIVGIGLGVLLIFVINKVRGRQLPNLSLSFTPKTYENQPN